MKTCICGNVKCVIYFLTIMKPPFSLTLNHFLYARMRMHNNNMALTLTHDQIRQMMTLQSAQICNQVAW